MGFERRKEAWLEAFRPWWFGDDAHVQTWGFGFEEKVRYDLREMV